MFDWEDEELTNMIWGEDGETGDHIVPLKLRKEQHNKKEQSEESKAEQKLTAAKIHLHDSKPGSSSVHNVDEAIPQPWPDSSETEVYKCLAEPSTREKTSELGKGSDIFHSTNETKEQGGFDEYDWANIDSFDDLDRMFSDVPIFGDANLSCVDKLWSYSKDVSNIPSKSLPSILDSQNSGLDIRTEFDQQEYRQFPLTGKGNGSSSQSGPSVHVAPSTELYRQHKVQPSVQDQPYHQKKMKYSKISSTSEAGPFQDLHNHRTPPSMNSPGKFVNQYIPSRSSLMAVNPKCESQRSRTSQYPHMPNQYMAPSGFGNLSNPNSTLPVLSSVRRHGVTNQLMHPSYNPAIDASTRPLPMTPQEKLEKLRRRQQMQAMLAIQRQHQQFRHSDQSLTPNCRHDNPLEQTNLQGLTTVPSFNPNSSLELNDSRSFAGADDDNSAEFSVLYRLQDVVSKLDVGVRTCIRDSLFRLADSAGKRHRDIAHKTSQDEHEATHQEEFRYRSDGIPYTETVTNPTDRTVAHLLFQRPLHMEGPESPASSKIGTEETANFCRVNKHKAKVEERPANSGTAVPNSGTSSAEASHGNKRKL